MLGIKGAFPYGNNLVIGFLRLVGLINAAIWFGAAVFFVFGAAPAAASDGMRSLLGPRNFPYFSVSVYHLIAANYYGLHLICSVIALLHMATEWVYLGKNPRRAWVLMLLGLALWGGLEDFVLQPRLKELHRTVFVGRVRPEQRDSARRGYAVWNVISRSLQFIMVGGLGIYMWRTANPPDPARFVPAAKFRG